MVFHVSRFVAGAANNSFSVASVILITAAMMEAESSQLRGGTWWPSGSRRN
jgi:hypothetical protein